MLKSGEIIENKLQSLESSELFFDRVCYHSLRETIKTMMSMGGTDKQTITEDEFLKNLKDEVYYFQNDDGTEMVRIQNTGEQDRAIIREIAALMDKDNAFSLFLTKLQGKNIDFGQSL